ncbi:MAG: CBS domain-containing protein [Gemmataceae bacterium]|nr:CBS domain-containing protein [Gemmataceae bacterium]
MAAPLTLLADTAADLMTPGPVSLVASSTTAEAAAFLTAKGYGAAMVVDAAGRPVGVVTKTDLLVHARQHPAAAGDDATKVTAVMTPAVFSVKADTPAGSVVAQFLALNVHHLFVTDAAGAVVGVISPVDVLRKLG